LEVNLLNDIKKTISFFGNAPAGSNTCLVSQKISTPYNVERINASFALNTERKLQLSFYISLDDDPTATNKPAGFDILGEYGQVNYLTGDDERKEIKCNALCDISNSWLKVYAINTDGFDHTIDAQIEITI
jgi:hypothetical protein